MLLDEFQKKILKQNYGMDIVSLKCQDSENTFYRNIEVEYRYERLNKTINWSCILPYNQTFYERITIMIKRDLREMGMPQ